MLGCEGSQRKKIKHRSLFYKAGYVGIQGVKSGFRKILAQIPILSFVSCEQLLNSQVYSLSLICKMGIKVEHTQHCCKGLSEVT